MSSDHDTQVRALLNRKLVQIAMDHGVEAEIRDEGDVAVFCCCTVPDGQGRRVVYEIEVVSTFAELRRVLGY